MRQTLVLASALFAGIISLCAQVSRSPKRGLIDITTLDNAADDNIWTSSSLDLTWYYNYGPTPSPPFSRSNLQFVPMLFGANQGFLDSVTQQLDSGANITHGKWNSVLSYYIIYLLKYLVLSFNEPDGPTSTGGSNVSPELAATTFMQEIEPLKKRGVKLGAPAVTGADSGLSWLQNFFAACDQSGGCSVDFIPLHFYGDFQGLASLIGQMRATYPNTSLWVTEFANPNVNLEESQTSYNQSSEYLDRLT